MNAAGRVWPAFTGFVRRFGAWGRYRADRKPLTTVLHDMLLRYLTRRRPPIGLPVFLLIVLAAGAWSASATAADCFRYGQVVTLSGRYFAGVAPVDDGVVRDQLHDAARRVNLLSLTTPFCVNADTVSRGVKAASTIQLHCPAIHPADGSALSLKGRIVGAHTGNGQTPVLLMCR